MEKYESKQQQINHPAALVFPIISRMDLMTPAMQDKVEEWEATPDSCSFKVKGMKVALRIAAYLGAEDDVTSPTFAIVNQYEGKRTIYHFDMYRIERIEEALDFGSEEYLSSGELCLVEWPEKIEALLPEDTMVVKIEILSDTARRFVIR